MSNKLIGEDIGITIVIGTRADGSAGAFPSTGGAGTGIAASGMVKRIGIKSSVDKTNVKGCGDVSKRNRYHSYEQSLEIEGFVPSAGYSFGAPGSSATTFDGMTAVGYHATVTYEPLHSLTTGFTYTGVITDWSGDASVASEQSEKISIDLNPDITT